MLTKAGHVTLFVDGFGVEVPEACIKGTKVKDGDSVSNETLVKLGERWRADATR